jgi:serine/threonine-protein kinase
MQIDGVSFSLREEHDFHWLQQEGRVFTVFDRQDSGNISFGVERDGLKRFIKYAGAQPVYYVGKSETAVAQLQSAMSVYEQMRHPSLVKLICHGPQHDGYVAAFHWFEGESLHTPSHYERFKQLPFKQRLRAFQAIVSFHCFVEEQGFVAVDFYAGSLMYDFDKQQIIICDIDLYQRKPFTNLMGRLWGSSRFMSPEEFQLGAAIDARTNVYTMGATAFYLFGDARNRSMQKWDASGALYEVATRAVQSERDDRYPTVAAFREAWETFANSI